MHTFAVGLTGKLHLVRFSLQLRFSKILQGPNGRQSVEDVGKFLAEVLRCALPTAAGVNFIYIDGRTRRCPVCNALKHCDVSVGHS